MKLMHAIRHALEVQTLNEMSRSAGAPSVNKELSDMVSSMR